MIAHVMIAASGLCFAPVLATAAETTRDIERGGVAGAELRISTYTPHGADCSPTDDVRITVRTVPAGGSLTTRPDTVIAGPSRLGAADCSGWPLAGLGVYYVLRPGFRGTDRFAYGAAFSNGMEHAAVTVTICRGAKR